jgi:polyribonucleotide nucleotidyltransferase
MFTIAKREIEWGGRTLTLETGKVARQADGAIMATYGETVVLCAAVAKKEASVGVDFFPLTIHYQEKTFAAGKIPGGFFKREGRPTEKETLTSRLIDRPIRPSFPAGFHNEVQIVCTVLSHDGVNNPDVVALIGASAALAISGAPLQAVLAAARVGFIEGEYVLNPAPEEMEDSDLDLIVAGTSDSVLMVESEAKMLSEAQMLSAVEFGHKEFQPVIKMIEELKEEAGKEAWTIEKPDHSVLAEKIAKLGTDGIRAAYKVREKQARVEAISAVKATITEALQAEIAAEDYDASLVSKLIKALEKNVVRGDVLENKIRIDGRGLADVRQIVSEASFLPRTHGSALFTRGETQALAVTTLGTAQDMQIIDALEGEYKENFMLHYNFPPYSVGEARMMRGPGRREIGHGKLAWRALASSIPSHEEFPYTIRVVSEVTESNGSSSMATVCSSCLSMMDAGVPIKEPVSGIAMGLIKEGDNYAVLSDILGDEDHLGDMDFKVAGPESGVTALQMDIKISGITFEIMKVALEQAKAGRAHIIEKMKETLAEGRGEINKNAPQIRHVKINKEKIGALIGPGGKMIREICDTTGVTIDIAEDGTVSVGATDGEAFEEAFRMINDVVAEVEVGKIYTGPIKKLLDFGAVVNIFGKIDGLVHISEIKNERIAKVSDVLKEDQEVKVKVVSVERGKIRLSMKRVDQETGEDISDKVEAQQKEAKKESKEKPTSDKDKGERNDKRAKKPAPEKAPNVEPAAAVAAVAVVAEEPKASEDNAATESDTTTEDAPKKKRRFF